MNSLEITAITGTPPFDVYVCEYSNTYCYLTDSGVTSVPPTLEIIIPEELTNVDELLVKIIDGDGCITFNRFDCPTTTTTTIPPTTTTTTTIPSNCYCLTFENTTVNSLNFSYVDCDGNSISSVIYGNSTLFYCGKDPLADDGVNITIGSDCVDNTCPSPTI
jgi:hypothetical protein